MSTLSLKNTEPVMKDRTLRVNVTVDISFDAKMPGQPKSAILTSFVFHDVKGSH
jgi:hypothetical protein